MSQSAGLDLTEAQTEHLRTTLIDYALSHGLVVRPQNALVAENPGNCLVAHAPVALHPTDFPRRAFQAAQDVQKDFNVLYAKIANDEAYMNLIMEELAPVDEFMKDLWSLHQRASKEGIVQPLSLGLFRSDYLLHSDSNTIEAAVIKQVEFNTISSSFASLSTKTAEVHAYCAKQGLYGRSLADNAVPRFSIDRMPTNNAMSALANGLAQGVLQSNIKGCVLMVVQADERNAFDQRWLEYSLQEQHGIACYRVPFPEIQQQCRVDDARNLFAKTPIEGEVPVSVVYYRAGYGPEDYKSEQDWQSRYLLERSTAIKCPTVITQLAGSKKVQQVLGDATTLQKFCTDAAATKLRDTFVGMHALDATPAGKEACRLALEEPQRFVLKPQREGGGHNIYRDAIPPFLQGLPRAQWAGYILMELILPPVQHNAIVRAGQVYPASVISELGIYGTILWHCDGTILHNEGNGHLLRTKARDTDEGGVAAGFACIDSIHLI